MKSSTTFVTAGCATAVALALVGAAYAFDLPASPVPADVVQRGDRIATEVRKAPAVIIEEVNLDAGISNLIRVEGEPPSI